MICATPGCTATATTTLLIAGNGRDDPSTATPDRTVSFCLTHAVQICKLSPGRATRI